MSNMTKGERKLYHSNVKAKSDWNAGIRFAEKKAKAEGLELGLEKGELNKAVSIAKNLKAKAMPIQEIAEITGLDVTEIEWL